ncbi:MAG: 5-oxoprolinase subunit B family protein [Nocardioidaceae bacterium]
MRLLPCGDVALLLEADSLDDVLAWGAAIEAAAIDGVEEMVPAARTLLVRVNPGRLGAVRRSLTDLPPPEAGVPATTSRDVVQLDVRYDGPDLDEVAALTGLGRGGVIAAHTGQTWVVAFCGFVPGFGYLVGDDDRLRVPRRNEPRTQVPAGAVALAGGYAGVYPRASPGGWQLIGRTDAPLWDADRDRPALLRAGVRVRFAEVPR